VADQVEGVQLAADPLRILHGASQPALDGDPLADRVGISVVLDGLDTSSAAAKTEAETRASDRLLGPAQHGGKGDGPLSPGKADEFDIAKADVKAHAAGSIVHESTPLIYPYWATGATPATWVWHLDTRVPPPRGCGEAGMS
jgi:hypothetical protein